MKSAEAASADQPNMKPWNKRLEHGTIVVGHDSRIDMLELGSLLIYLPGCGAVSAIVCWCVPVLYLPVHLLSSF